MSETKAKKLMPGTILGFLIPYSADNRFVEHCLGIGKKDEFPKFHEVKNGQNGEILRENIKNKMNNDV